MSGAERREFLLPAYVGVCSIAQSYTRQLHLKAALFSPKISFALRSLKLSACFSKYFINSISQRMTSLKAHVSLCGLVHALDSWRAVSERYWSGTGAKRNHRSGLWIKTCSALRLYFARSALLTCPVSQQ